jgi:hypothetical protein
MLAAPVDAGRSCTLRGPCCCDAVTNTIAAAIGSSRRFRFAGSVAVPSRAAQARRRRNLARNLTGRRVVDIGVQSTGRHAVGCIHRPGPQTDVASSTSVASGSGQISRNSAW